MAPMIVMVAYIMSLFLLTPIWQVFGVILLALVLFTTEFFSVDITAILVMLILMLLGVVTPEQGVSGFANTATITVLAMFILSGAIARTGAIQKLGHFVFKYAKKSFSLQLLFIALIVAPLSGLFNNTAAVAIFLPMIMNLSKISRTPATKLLIPLSFLAMMGGTLTLVGTSTNILANSILTDYGQETFNMFDFTHIGFIVLFVGILYFLLIGRFLLPNRKNEGNDKDMEDVFMSELEIKEGSKFIGKDIEKIKFTKNHGVQVFKIIRNGKSYVSRIEKKVLRQNDIILFKANEQKIVDINMSKTEKILLNFNVSRRRMPTTSGKKIVKVAVPNLFHKRSLASVGFWNKFSAAVIGIKKDKLPNRKTCNMPLKRGEIVLVKVAESKLANLERSTDLVLLEELEQKYDSTKTWTAGLIMLFVVGLAAFNVMPIMVSAILGVFLMVVTNCLRPSEIYKTVSWDVIFLLAGLIPLGIALQTSGAADLIANYIVDISDLISPLLLLMVFYLFTTLLTEIISNNAAVVLLIPIATTVALKLGLNPIAFALIVMFAASTSFLSPVGYQTNTMVYAAGNYKFYDFMRVGLFLNLILMVVTVFLVYTFFGLKV